MAKAKTARTTSNPTQPTEISLVPEVKKILTPINLDEEIRRRAYELYEERGSVSGFEHEDWLTAEREVTARYNRKQSA